MPHLGPGRRMRGLRAAVVAGLATFLVTTVAAGCATTRYTYVSSTATQTFFKVPSSWRVFSQTQTRHDLSLTGSGSFPFLSLFDADPHPSETHDISSADHPFGLARVRTLSLQEHDEFSFMTLRNEVFKIDDAINADPNSVDVLTAKLVVHDGLRGSHLEYTVHPPDGPSFSVDQVGLVDTPTHQVWFLAVGCQADCYHANAGAIHRIVDSWTVEGK